VTALSALVPLMPALVCLAAVTLFAYGWRLMRSDVMAGLDVQDLVLLRKEQRKEAGRTTALARLGDRLVLPLRSLIGPAGIRWLQRQVDLAGRPDGATVDTVLRQFGIWIVLVTPLVIMFLLQGNFFFLLLCVALVLIMPLARLTRARRVRQERLNRDLPDFLDILSVTVSAGVGFRPALARVADRYGGPLADEMMLTLNQIANGASRRAAFTSLRTRNDSESLAQFVTAFLQSEELGAPLAETLNQIAIDMRRSNAQQLRRKAAQTVPRVTLITSLVLVPGALILIAVGMYLGSGITFSSILGGAG
jgi:tight adherence protein C